MKKQNKESQGINEVNLYTPVMAGYNYFLSEENKVEFENQENIIYAKISADCWGCSGSLGNPKGKTFNRYIFEISEDFDVLLKELLEEGLCSELENVFRHAHEKIRADCLSIDFLRGML